MTKELADSDVETINIRRLLIFRNSLHEFISTLQGHIYFFVIESAWKKLVKRLEKVKTFSNVFKYHFEYLKAIGEGSFVFKKKNIGHELVLGVMSIVSNLSGIVNYLKIGVNYDENTNNLQNRLNKLEGKFDNIKAQLNHIMTKNLEGQDKAGIVDD